MKTLSILIITLMFSMPVTINAQSVRDVMSSESYKNLVKGGKRAAIERRNQPQHSEYLKLFSGGRNGAKPLLSWIGEGSEQFKKHRSGYDTHKGFIEANTSFSIIGSPEDDKISLIIYVPKPPSVAASTMGLFKEFIILQPPELAVEQEEEIVISSFKGKIYHHKNEGACSLLLKMSHGSILNLHTKTCANREYLIALANSLDIKRLNQKLNS